ncbi:MAG: hypothetical protein CFE28_03890 [Alphaproteobacteria bacterium PA2]|nr:MAG: hypothetical protein CFE28_03890 [Alphaproteobacteria bacterium PA2]
MDPDVFHPAPLGRVQGTTLPTINEFEFNHYAEEEEILDDDMMDMIRNNPADVVYNAFSQAFLQ